MLFHLASTISLLVRVLVQHSKHKDERMMVKLIYGMVQAHLHHNIGGQTQSLGQRHLPSKGKQLYFITLIYHCCFTLQFYVFGFYKSIYIVLILTASIYRNPLGIKL